MASDRLNRIVNAEEMRSIDEETIKSGYGSQALMTLAAYRSAKFIKNFTKKSVHPQYNQAGSKNINKKKLKVKAAVLCGPGNNGGDGFAVAWFMSQNGFDVTVYFSELSPPKKNAAGDWFRFIKDQRIIIQPYDSIKGNCLNRFDLIIDALFGTGLQTLPRAPYRDLILKMNQSETKTISLDIPSGLRADGPVIPPGDLIKPLDVFRITLKEITDLPITQANATIAVGYFKENQTTGIGKALSGKLYLADIGFPDLPQANLFKKTSKKHRQGDRKNYKIFDKYNFQQILGNIQKDPLTHKKKEGSVLIIGGFNGMEGAALLAADAALKSGAALVTVITTDKSRPVIAGKIPEMMTKTSEEPYDLSDYDTVLIGPGMGRSSESSDVFHHFILKLTNQRSRKTIIDGDGLYHLSSLLRETPHSTDFFTTSKKNHSSENTFFIPGKQNDMILLPHAYEAKYLTESIQKFYEITNDKKSSPPLPENVITNRFQAVYDICFFFKSITVLKGPGTITATKKRAAWVNLKDGPFLACGGSGDVLAGITAGVVSGRIEKNHIEENEENMETILNRTAGAVYLHSMAGRKACGSLKNKKTKHIKAGDIVKKIPAAFSQLQVKTFSLPKC